MFQNQVISIKWDLEKMKLFLFINIFFSNFDAKYGLDSLRDGISVERRDFMLKPHFLNLMNSRAIAKLKKTWYFPN